MIEQVPLSLVLYDRVVSRPAYDRIQDDTLIGEGAVGVITNGVAQEVAVARRVREVILAVVLVHPRCLEEAVRVAGLQGLSVLVEDDNGTRCLGKLLHVVGHANHIAGQCRCIGLGEELCLVVGSRAKVNETVVITVLAGDGLEAMIKRTSPLQLSAPESSEVAIDLTVVVLEHTGVNGERATDGKFLGDERAFGLVGHGYAQTEHAAVLFGREDEVVLAVFLDDVVVPHLFLGPGHIFHVEDDTMVGNFAIFNIVPR